ncbi:unnamed protein product [Mytilus coruscus]|uniref:Uncharacterized protein n=1 Tax=Mytilus coruscus TaxID=42192 RepID=A0A6J8BMK1_MYTCO|nr:unnamed protein product [Mytilus coruscus]
MFTTRHHVVNRQTIYYAGFPGIVVDNGGIGYLDASLLNRRGGGGVLSVRKGSFVEIKNSIVQNMRQMGIEARNEGTVKVNVLRLVKRYFEMEFLYRDIVKILQMNHAISISLRQVKRKIIWLKVGRSSSNPKVIARYFLDAIEEHRGHPYSMRGDMGTENGLVAVMQTLFAGDEVTIPFIYGKAL